MLVSEMTMPSEPTDALVAMLRGLRLMVLTGAGISTDSGIPDYRGPTTKHIARTPIQHAAFVGDARTRRRYWARSFVGYPRIATARPNAAHHALAAMESAGLVTGLVTQNVDTLHTRAGSRALIELHGSLARVRCLACDASLGRDVLQTTLEAYNPTFNQKGEWRADGDVVLEEAAVEGFVVPECEACGGVLMPDVVFFGGSVPKTTVAEAHGWLDASDALLVVGSSLTVFSGYRFARHAHATGKPVVLVTYGETRADAIAALRVDAPIGTVVPALAKALGATIRVSD
jgi:NAD-dependent deacetylase sirtuin 4